VYFEIFLIFVLFFQCHQCVILPQMHLHTRGTPAPCQLSFFLTHCGIKLILLASHLYRALILWAKISHARYLAPAGLFSLFLVTVKNSPAGLRLSKTMFYTY